jgi:Guanosine polyphosphate pyrophosphohydrolases/synthetases
LQQHIALKIARKAHKGQVDKAGVDYIQHPIAVAHMLLTDEEKAVAYLHDTLEDTEYTAQDLLDAGINDDVVTAVVIITKKQGQEYFEYLSAVKSNVLARAVKIADLTHNMDLSRLQIVTEEDILRIEKYRKALSFLQQ